MSRTNRRDIFDNFEDPQQVSDLVELMRTMPGAKLAVRRSRRRPIAKPYLDRGDASVFGLAPGLHAMWTGNTLADAAFTQSLRVRDIIAALEPTLVFREWNATSPASWGRQNGKRKKREGSSSLTVQTMNGRIDVVGHTMVPRGTAYLINERGTLSAVGARLTNIVQLANVGAPGAKIHLHPHDWAALAKEMSGLRLYESGRQHGSAYLDVPAEVAPRVADAADSFAFAMQAGERTANEQAQRYQNFVDGVLGPGVATYSPRAALSEFIAEVTEVDREARTITVSTPPDPE